MAEKDNPKISSLIIKIIFLMATLVMVLVSRYAFIFIFAAMLPAITALTIDKHISKYASSTLCAFNLIGAMPFIFNMFKASLIDEEARMMLANNIIWLRIYGSTALGWVMIWIIPRITSMIFIARTKSRIEKIINEQNKIIAEWGLHTTDK